VQEVVSIALVARSSSTWVSLSSETKLLIGRDLVAESNPCWSSNVD